MNLLLAGAVAMACFTASLFFLRFWKTTKDRFFLFFAASFCLHGLSWAIKRFGNVPSDNEPLIYLIRLCAFLVILFAIIDKNWIGKHKTPDR